MNYKYPECNAVIDVTKPPYNVDNTGKTDCTAALCKVFDDICGEYKANLLKTKAMLEKQQVPEESLIQWQWLWKSAMSEPMKENAP